jgi:hypothetical protein
MEALLGPEAADARTPAELVRAAVAGDRGAFATLVEPSLAVALGGAIALTGSHADGADAVQDALLAAWQGLDRLAIRPPSQPGFERTSSVGRFAWHADVGEWSSSTSRSSRQIPRRSIERSNADSWRARSIACPPTTGRC